jgi:hypothetical protein
MICPPDARRTRCRGPREHRGPARRLGRHGHRRRRRHRPGHPHRSAVPGSARGHRPRRPPLNRHRTPTLAQLCRHPHISASRRGRARGPLDDTLHAAGLKRHVAAVVPTFAVATLLVASSHYVGLVPQRLAKEHGRTLGIRWFPNPGQPAGDRRAHPLVHPAQRRPSTALATGHDPARAREACGRVTPRLQHAVPIRIAPRPLRATALALLQRISPVGAARALSAYPTTRGLLPGEAPQCTALRRTDRSTLIEPTRLPLVAAVPICVESCRGHRSEPCRETGPSPAGKPVRALPGNRSEPCRETGPSPAGAAASNRRTLRHPPMGRRHRRDPLKPSPWGTGRRDALNGRTATIKPATTGLPTYTGGGAAERAPKLGSPPNVLNIPQPASREINHCRCILRPGHQARTAAVMTP